MSPTRGGSKRFSTGLSSTVPIASATWLTVAGELAARPVHGRARRVHDTANAFVARGEQDVQRPLDVHRARGERVLHRPRHRAERTQVEHDLRAADGVVHALVRPELALDDLDVD